MRKTLLFISLATLVSAQPALAVIGVGVGTGKIVVEEALVPGTVYELPSLTVINTGDEASGYYASVAYHQDQPELAPPLEWFSFTPKEFYLEPGQAQEVEITLSLPLKAEPGSYFAYLEGRPVKKAQQGGITTIGVAAAAKLNFDVKAANVFDAIYFRILSLWKLYSPWSGRVAVVITVLIVALVAKKYLNIEFSVKKKRKS